MKNKKSGSILCLLCIGLVLLLPFVFMLLMSFRDYRVVSGLFGSPFVGFANIAEFFERPNLGRILINTFTISILALLVGAVYVFVSFQAICSCKNSIVKVVLTIVFALPAMIPVNAYLIMLLEILPTEFLISSSFLLQVIAALENGLRFSAVFVIAVPFAKDRSLRGALKYVLVYVALRLFHILAMDTGFMNGFYNPLTYEHLDTYSTFLYRTGLMQSEYSGYAAGYVIALLIQLLPAVLGGVLLCTLFKSKTAFGVWDGGFSPCIIFAVLPVWLLFQAMEACAEGILGLELPIVRQAYVNGVLMAAVSAVVVVAVGILLAGAAGNLGTGGICILAGLYYVSDNLLGYYFIGRDIGVYDTIIGVVYQNIHLTLPVALIGVLILKEQCSRSDLLTFAVSALGLAFAWFWGDHMSALVTLRSAHKYPISLMMHQLINRQSAIDYSSEYEMITGIPYIVVPVLVAGFCIAISGIRLKQDRQSEE